MRQMQGSPDLLSSDRTRVCLIKKLQSSVYEERETVKRVGGKFVWKLFLSPLTLIIKTTLPGY